MQDLGKKKQNHPYLLIQHRNFQGINTLIRFSKVAVFKNKGHTKCNEKSWIDSQNRKKISGITGEIQIKSRQVDNMPMLTS